MQEWQENEAEKTMGKEENEPVSMPSDAEREGWRRELQSRGAIRPGSPGLNVAQEGNPWTSDRAQQSFVTESDGFL